MLIGSIAPPRTVAQNLTYLYAFRNPLIFVMVNVNNDVCASLRYRKNAALSFISHTYFFLLFLIAIRLTW